MPCQFARRRDSRRRGAHQQFEQIEQFFGFALGNRDFAFLRRRGQSAFGDELAFAEQAKVEMVCQQKMIEVGDEARVLLFGVAA